MAPQRKVLKFKKQSFLTSPQKPIKNQWENMVFCIAKNMKTLTPSEGFQGTIKKDYILNLCSFWLSPKSWKCVGEIKSGKPFSGNQKNRKKCYHESQTHFLSIWGNKTFPIFILLCLFFYLPPHPSKMITSGKVLFPSFRTIGKVTFLKVLIFDVGTETAL